ncbi:MAG: tRNA pseudouridine(55) synthase TruB [Bacteroidales bacterium]|nr:tRNA pseudouridine(55) synthase TruB [Bacteroidales bacterium]
MNEKLLTPFEQGQVLLIDKPYGWTSFQVVNKLKWQIRHAHKLAKLKIGHAGTLDPLATGLLIICTGKFTKRIEEFQAQEKEYTGTFTLGATTPCYDMEKPVDKTFPTNHITEQLILETAKTFVGEQMQVPPIFSAVKIDGRRAYDYARQEQEVEIKAKPVFIKTFEITRIEMPEIDFRIVCSKGTYIRSMARDFGEKLQSGAYLSALRRTRIGDFLVENCRDENFFTPTV